MEDRKEVTPSNLYLVRQSKSVTFWNDQKSVASVCSKKYWNLGLVFN